MKSYMKMLYQSRRYFPSSGELRLSRLQTDGGNQQFVRIGGNLGGSPSRGWRRGPPCGYGLIYSGLRSKVLEDETRYAITVRL